jgi:N-hydroxyarylamine O-acetyltransferase
MDIKRYLERINYLDPVNPTFEVLSKLQMMHLLYVPFENLDIHNNIKIDLANLFDKIVNRERGGFCYELNGLFYELLLEIGFKVKMVSARVYDGKEGYSPEFDHMALIVNIENAPYLVDVGFGEFSLCPIKIELNKELNDQRGIFRIETFDENYKVV